MGRSVSYPGEALVVTFSNPEFDCSTCEEHQHLGKGRVPCDCSDDTSALSAEDREDCTDCDGLGHVQCPDCYNGTRNADGDDYDMLIDDFRDQLSYMFPSVVHQDTWIGREDHVLAGNKLALFGMSEYCGLISYWIVPQTLGVYDRLSYGLCEAWIRKQADKFVKAFGELSKIGSMSNGEGVYRRIDR